MLQKSHSRLQIKITKAYRNRIFLSLLRLGNRIILLHHKLSFIAIDNHKIS